MASSAMISRRSVTGSTVGYLWGICTLLYLIGTVQHVSSRLLIDPRKHEIQIVSPDNYDSKVVRGRTEKAFLVLLYDDSGESKRIIEKVNRVAVNVRGMVDITAMDCVTHKKKCTNISSSTEYPLLMVLPRLPQPPRSWDLSKSEKELIDMVMSLIPTYYTVLTSENFESFIGKNYKLPKVIFVHHSFEVPPPYIAAISTAFKSQMDVGTASKANLPQLPAKYFGGKHPTGDHLRVIRKGQKDAVYGQNGSTAIWEYQPVFDWINIFSETFAGSAGYDDGTGGDDSSDDKPWLFSDFPKMDIESHQDICFKKSDQGLCVILLNKGSSVFAGDLNTLISVRDKFLSHLDGRGAAFRFMWMDLETEKNFLELFFGETDLSKVKTPSLVVFNPNKRLRFFVMDPSKTATNENITSMLEKVSGGDARFTNVKGQKLPEFAPKVKKPPTKEEL